MTAPARHVLRALGVLLAAATALTVAVLLAPVVQGLLVEHVGVNRPYAKIFRYVAALSLLLPLVLVLRPWRDVPRDVYGLRGPASRPSLAVLGMATALVVLLSIALFDAASGHLTWDRWGPKKFAVRWKPALVRGLVLGLLEEVVFRGWLYHRLPSRWSAWARALGVAFVFAFLHAFRETDAPKDLPATAASGVAILEAWGSNLLDLGEFLPSAFGLFLLSLASSAAYLRYSTLWFGVGMHGLAVAYLPLHSALTQRSVERDWAGSKWLYDGVPGYVALGLLAWLLWPRRRRADATP